MKILFLSRRDVKNPLALWAEIILWNYAKWLEKKWYEITFLAWCYENCLLEENFENIKIIRIWNEKNVFLEFRKYYKKNFIWKFDLIIDSVSRFSFFTPIFAWWTPIIFFVNYLADKEFDLSYKFPLNKIKKYFFKDLIYLYQNKNTIVVSESLKKELIQKYQFRENKIFVLENPIDINFLNSNNFIEKQNEILFFWRVDKIKNIEDIIKAFAYFNKKNPNYILNIVWPITDKKYFIFLEKLISKLNLSWKIFFREKVSFDKKELIAKNKLLITTSYKEWYGLSVLDANIYWIPAIWYEADWIKESIVSGKNWFLVKNWDFEWIWEMIFQILKDDESYFDLSNSVYEFIKNYKSLNKSVDDFENIIKNVLK